MSAVGHFPAAAQWLTGAHLGIVTSVEDPLSLARVKVTLPGPDPAGEAPVWARVATAFAADNCGAFLIPDVGSEVLVVFPSGDAAYPIVVGALWNGKTEVPEALGGSRVDRWTITGTNGTRIAIVEESAGQELVEITTPGGATATLTDASGGEIKLEVAGNTITMGTSGVKIEAAANVEVTAAQVKVSAGMVDVQSGFSKFSGVVQCDTLVSNSVVSTSYTPGAGNIW